jgi:mediator of RNA polymerase II transcription subunit 15, fungi type
MINTSAPAITTQMKLNKPPVVQNKKPATVTNRRKGSHKGPINVASIPTPAGNASTPGSLAGKTPNSMGTPQVPQTQSNKNTPTDQSPNYAVKHAAIAAIPTTDADIFTNTNADTKLARRRDLSNNDPEKFFYASLVNLLELDESLADAKDLPIISPWMGAKSAKSPLSPALSEWTCEIKPNAIASSFKQVDYVRELVANDIVENCSKLALDESEPINDSWSTSSSDFSLMNMRKRSNDMLDEGDDIDNLFTEKKPKVEEDEFKYIYEPVGFDDWKQFMVSSMQ